METTGRMYSHHVEDEYQKFVRRMNPPRVVIDNQSCKNATVIQVDSANKHGILLEVVQVLTDLNFVVTKAYISSDGGWFMDVFNVTDHEGNKITDEGTLDYIQKVLGSETSFTGSIKSVGSDRTVIELIGTDRPGLLSEVCAVLTHLKCNVLNAEVWTHNTRAAFIVQVTDNESGLAVTDPERLSIINQMLCNVLKVSNKAREAKTVVSLGAVHTERRLHQMMLEDRDYDYEGNGSGLDGLEPQKPDVNVVNWFDKDCSVVTVRCKDRPKLLFDTICTLTDLEYVVFHGHVDAEGPNAYQMLINRASVHRNGLLSLMASKSQRKLAESTMQATSSKKPRSISTTTPSSSMKDSFVQYTEYLNQLNDKRERVVKASRDITINSKKVIFQVHRISKNNKDEVLEKAEKDLSNVKNQHIARLVNELQGTDFWKLRRAYSPGIQEYVEAATLCKFCTAGTLLNLDEINEMLLPLSDPSNEPLQINILDYILGLADLTGELMRLAIGRISDGELEYAKKICRFVREIYRELTLVAPKMDDSSDMKTKMDVMLQSVMKIENACFGVHVRGSEYIPFIGSDDTSYTSLGVTDFE